VAAVKTQATQYLQLTSTGEQFDRFSRLKNAAPQLPKPRWQFATVSTESCCVVVVLSYGPMEYCGEWIVLCCLMETIGGQWKSCSSCEVYRLQSMIESSPARYVGNEVRLHHDDFLDHVVYRPAVALGQCRKVRCKNASGHCETVKTIWPVSPDAVQQQRTKVVVVA
jgi:hypothetical protein